MKIQKIGNENELDKILNRDFVSTIRKGFVEVNEEKFCLVEYYRDYVEKIRKFQVRDDDVFITGHPKTGTTWCTEMVWMIANDLNYERAKETIQKRTGFLELATVFDFDAIEIDDARECHPFEGLEKLGSPRTIKTHLPWSLLPEQIQKGERKPKIITIIRNPQDVCISYYHHSKFIEGYRGNFEDFCELFLAGRAMFGPFWKQILSYWNERDRSNLLILKYKDMKSDLPSIIRQVATFLGKNFTEEQVNDLTQYLSFETMKKNPAVNFENITSFTEKHNTTTEKNCFLRSGKEGAYRGIMSPELITRFENWTKECTAGSGLTL